MPFIKRFFFILFSFPLYSFSAGSISYVNGQWGSCQTPQQRPLMIKIKKVEDILTSITCKLQRMGPGSGLSSYEITETPGSTFFDSASLLFHNPPVANMVSNRCSQCATGSCPTFPLSGFGYYSPSTITNSSSKIEMEINLVSRDNQKPISIDCGQGGTLVGSICKYDSVISNNGESIISIYGEFEKISEGVPPFNPSSRILDILQWGDSELPLNSNFLFSGSNLESYSALDMPNFQYGTSLQGFFRSSNFNGNISNWNMTNVVDLSFMFAHNHIFNQPLNWDTSNVTDLTAMFYNASAFNSDINFSSVASVIYADGMFTDALSMKANASSLNFSFPKPTDGYLIFDDENYECLKKPVFLSSPPCN